MTAAVLPQPEPGKPANGRRRRWQRPLQESSFWCIDPLTRERTGCPTFSSSDHRRTEQRADGTTAPAQVRCPHCGSAHVLLADAQDDEAEEE